LSRRLRTPAAIVVAVALLAQTWLWIAVMGAPIGYSFDLRGEAFAYRQFFFVGGALGDLAPASNMSISASSRHFEQDWGLAGGGAVHISEEVAPHVVLLGGPPSDDELIAALQTRTKWQESTALGGRVNALKATIGRTSVSIEGPLSYDDLFRIAESLRPEFASL
jgi:hypothetical protein